MELFSIDFELFQGIAMPLVGVASSFLGCLIWTSNIINPGFLHPASEMIIIICNSFFVFVPCMDELSWIWIESNWLELTRIEWTNKLHAALTRFVLAGLKHLLGTLTEPCEVPIYEDYLTQIFFKQNTFFFLNLFCCWTNHMEPIPKWIIWGYEVRLQVERFGFWGGGVWGFCWEGNGTYQIVWAMCF